MSGDRLHVVTSLVFKDRAVIVGAKYHVVTDGNNVREFKGQLVGYSAEGAYVTFTIDELLDGENPFNNEYTVGFGLIKDMRLTD